MSILLDQVPNVSGAVTHVVSNHIGFPLAVVNSVASVIWEADASPFGEVVNLVTGSDSTDPDIRYPGQWRQDPAGYGLHDKLYFNVHRWYSPVWGRYTQPDPLQSLLLSDGASLAPKADPRFSLFKNAYSYANADPLRFFDPVGLCDSCDDCPSGQWEYFGIAASLAAGMAVTHASGTFQCLGRFGDPGMKVPVVGGCFVAGFIWGGIGLEGTPGFNNGRACNAEELIGAPSSGSYTSAGPISVSTTTPDGQDSLLTTIIGVGKMWGWGHGHINCNFRPRTGPIGAR